MGKGQWQPLIEISGEPQAEILKGLLEAQGISVRLSQEGVGRVLAVTVGPLGQVQILVPEDELAQARKVIEKYNAGEFENQILSEEDTESEAPQLDET
jgi:hypothetical protein